MQNQGSWRTAPNLWDGSGLVILSALGCNNKAIQSIELESAQTSSDVEALKIQVKELQGIVEQNENFQDELLEQSEKLSEKIEGIEESLGVLRSADENAANQITELSSKLDEANTAVSDLYTFVKDMRVADQIELEQMQERQARIAEASRPIMQRIAQLTAKRGEEMARLMEINRKIENGPGRAPGVSDYAAAQAALSTMHLQQDVNRLLAQRASAIQHSIDQIDAAIQNERVRLRDIQNAP